MTMPKQSIAISSGLYLALALTGPSASAQSGGDPAAGATVVITGSPRGQQVLNAPYAISVVDDVALRSAGPQVNLSEALARVPGLVVNNRNNYAQDLQISSRGFGARAGFGVRGMRMYTDGIPATMPDGQGQVAHFDLSSAQRIEVLRGPFSVLYGNSSGGVIALFTAPVRSAGAELTQDAGNFGFRQTRASVAAPLGNGFDLRVSGASMQTDGFRPQSAAERKLANVRLGWQGERDQVVLLLSDHHQTAQDPLGLTPAQFDADPRQTTSVATQFNARKRVQQSQAGASWRHQFADAGVLRESSLTVYDGRRSVTQWQAIPVATQAPASSGGGVVDFDRHYNGFEAKLSLRLGDADVVAGVARDNQQDQRRGYENFTGAGAAAVLGVTGKLRRDETNRAVSDDAFVQALLPLSDALALTGGVRTGKVHLSTGDHYIVLPGNKDDSGVLDYSYFNPVAGLRWTLQPGWTLHASVANGFESPTLGELAYRADGAGGFNTGLKGQSSRQFELGSKWRVGTVALDAALFIADTRDEIGVLSNSGGRSTFQNVGRTRRQGLEAGGDWRVMPGLRLAASLTLLQAKYLDNFLTCAAAGCPSVGTPKVAVAAGNRIAGTQASSGWAEVAWRPGLVPGEVGLELRGNARSAANDTNTVFAPGYGLVNLRWSGRVALGQSDALELLARVDNAADRVHVGSVIVNDANGRFFEPGTPRSLLLSARWLHAW